VGPSPDAPRRSRPGGRGQALARGAGRAWR
jgi:hypothetical protein